jgi:hypothetical protein
LAEEDTEALPVVVQPEKLPVSKPPLVTPLPPPLVLTVQLKVVEPDAVPD